MTTTSEKMKVTLIPGDGIGPECVGSVRRVFDAARVPIEWEECEAGAEVFRRGLPSGVPQETIDSLSRTRVALKGPLETPVGFGEKSANVTLRKLFELFGNVRPTREIPGVKALFAGRMIDFVVVRENVEDLYAGIEHMQTPGVAQCLKLISRKGCEKIVRLAFELARAEGRGSVHCATKSNIMKMTEGLLKRTFEEVSRDYPDIRPEHVIIDNCAHQLVRYPEQFEVIVTTNMNGDIISDLASGLTGGLGLAPSANIGHEASIFEAVHGSAPTIAGKDLANPTAMLLSSVMLLRHLELFSLADEIEHAVVMTIEEGRALTVDLSGDDSRASTTTEFTDEIIANLGRRSRHWPEHRYKAMHLPRIDPRPDYVRVEDRRVIGFDLFIESPLSPQELGKSLDAHAEDSPYRLKMISNRGTKVYPGPTPITDCVDHWRCRFVVRDEEGAYEDESGLRLISRIAREHAWMHIEKLPLLNGEAGFTRAQGED